MLTVSGTRVNVAQAIYEGGTTIVAGAFLEIKGTWDGNVLQASKVELERNDRDNDGYADRNELYGAVSSVATSNGRTQLVINGVTVDVTQAYFKNGSLTQLAVWGACGSQGFRAGQCTHCIQGGIQVGFQRTPGRLRLRTIWPQITNFVSAANFKVNGVQVDASNARFDHGTASSLTNGIYVEPKGAQNAQGIFIAREIEPKNGR